jgi:hypothetical protein
MYRAVDLSSRSRQGCTILTEDVWRPNFFFSGLTFFAELAQEYAQGLATAV